MEKIPIRESGRQSLPWWTWVLPIILIHLGTEFSLQFKYAQGVVDHYLPTAISIILINWWGPLRVLPAMYINATLSTGAWGIADPTLWPIYALPETAFTFLSWLLFSKLSKSQYWIPDIRNLVVFIFLAILIPIIVEVTSLELLLIYFEEHQWSDFFTYFVRNALGEFTSNFGLALPILYYVTPYMQRSGLLLNPPPEALRYRSSFAKSRMAELLGI
jgi:hypothetical protein